MAVKTMLNSRDFDVYLAGRILNPRELVELNAEQLVVLRTKIRAEILQSPEIQKRLRAVADETVREFSAGTTAKSSTSR